MPETAALQDRDLNLWTCRRCGRVQDIGTDDYAGDEAVVADRMAHDCVDGWWHP